MMFLLGSAPVVAQQQDSSKTDDLVARINRARVDAGALPLVRSSELDAAAQAHSVDIVQHDYLDHTGSDGSEPQERADKAGYHVPPQSAWIVVEVISAISGDPQGPVDWWLNGDPQVHGKVVLDPRWPEIGAGYAEGGQYGNYWTALFGCRPAVLPSVSFDDRTYTPEEKCGDPGAVQVEASPTPRPSPTTPPTLVATPVPTPTPPRVSAAVQSDSLRVSWSNIGAPNALDWMGVYRRGDDDTQYVDWTYVGCSRTAQQPAPSKSCQLSLPGPAGTYEVRLFGNNGYTRLASSEPIIVQRATIAVSPERATPKTEINVRWSGIATPSATDWVGMYRVGDADTAPLDWLYVGCARVPLDARALGSCNMQTPDASGQATYEFRLFLNNAYQRVATTSAVRVDPSAS